MVEEKSGISNFTKKIKMDSMGQYKLQIAQHDILENHNFDFDAEDGYVTLQERRKIEEQQKKAKNE